MDYGREQAFASAAAIPATLLGVGITLTATTTGGWRLAGIVLIVAPSIPLVLLAIGYWTGRHPAEPAGSRVLLADGTVAAFRRHVPTAWIIGVVAVLVLVGTAPVAYWLWAPTSPASLQSRVRIQDVIVVGTPNVAGWPVVNVYYDNAGSVAARGVVPRYRSAIWSGELPSQRIEQIQDDILRWDGWQQEVAAKDRSELHPGAPWQFITLPPKDDDFARALRAAFADIAAGRATLYIFIAFKYRDSSMSPNTVGVTEDCFWFSGGNFARHNCGRGRSFLERR